MPKFAANLTMLFNEVPFLDRFGAAADAGFDAVEFLFPYPFAVVGGLNDRKQALVLRADDQLDAWHLADNASRCVADGGADSPADELSLATVMPHTDQRADKPASSHAQLARRARIDHDRANVEDLPEYGRTAAPQRVARVVCRCRPRDGFPVLGQGTIRLSASAKSKQHYHGEHCTAHVCERFHINLQGQMTHDQQHLAIGSMSLQGITTRNASTN